MGAPEDECIVHCFLVTIYSYLHRFIFMWTLNILYIKSPIIVEDNDLKIPASK